MLRNVSSAIGAQVSTYGVGLPLKPFYAADPVGVSVFIGSVQLPVGIEHEIDPKRDRKHVSNFTLGSESASYVGMEWIFDETTE